MKHGVTRKCLRKISDSDDDDLLENIWLRKHFQYSSINIMDECVKDILVKNGI